MELIFLFFVVALIYIISPPKFKRSPKFSDLDKIKVEFKNRKNGKN